MIPVGKALRLCKISFKMVFIRGNAIQERIAHIQSVYVAQSSTAHVGCSVTD